MYKKQKTKLLILLLLLSLLSLPSLLYVVLNIPILHIEDMLSSLYTDVL